MDSITINNALFSCNLGVTEQERKEKQPIQMNIILFLDLKPAGKTDDLKKTVNYSEVYKKVKLMVEKRSYNLIEALAEEISKKLLADFPVQKVTLTIKKPNALPHVTYAAVTIERNND